MEQLKISKGKDFNPISLALVLVLSGFILFAAYGKLFFPSEELYVLDYSVSFFEIVFLGFLFFFRHRIEMWLVASLVFAAWAGYALFWYIVELPCQCMGTAVTIPEGFSLGLDAVFYATSLSMMFVLGATQRWLILSPVNGLIFVAGGFSFAQWIYAVVLSD